MIEKFKTAADKFHASYTPEPNTGCWIWTEVVADERGYGVFYWHGEQQRAHRWSYANFIGPILNDLTIDHLCRVRSCVNPKHLEAVTLKENILRGFSWAANNARKMTCPKGHQYNRTGGHGQRVCYLCINERQRNQRDKATIASRKWRLENPEKYREQQRRQNLIKKLKRQLRNRVLLELEK